MSGPVGATEVLIVLIALGLQLALWIAGVVAIIKVFRMHRDIRDLKAQITEIRVRLLEGRGKSVLE